jgi:tricorn protease-like protein
MDKQFTLRAIMMIALVSTIIGIGVTPMMLQHQSYSVGGGVDDNRRTSFRGGGDTTFSRVAAAPIVTSGDNVYITWWTNKTGNNEVMFRASTDGGKTFGDKINLSNSTVNSERAEIGTSGKNVFVTWWETMNGKDVPMLRVSTDNGKTFEPILNLSTNGTIGTGGG